MRYVPLLWSAALLRAVPTLAQRLPPAQLPAAGRTALVSDYKAYKVGEAASLVRANGRTVHEVEISKKQEVLCAANGKVTR